MNNAESRAKGVLETCRFYLGRKQTVYFQKTRLTFKEDDCQFHKLRVNDSEVNNGSFKLPYKVTKWFLLLFGSAILRPTNYGNIVFVQGCLQYLK